MQGAFQLVTMPQEIANLLEVIPEPDDGDSGADYSSAIQQAVLREKTKINKGANPGDTYKRQVEYWSEIFSHSILEDELVVTDEDLLWGIKMALPSGSQLTQHKVKAFPTRMVGMFRMAGWVEIEQRHLPGDSELSEFNHVLAHPKLPGLSDLFEEVIEHHILSTQVLTERCVEYLENADLNNGYSDDAIDVAVARNESLLANRDWLKAPLVDHDISLWLNEDVLIADLSSNVDSRAELNRESLHSLVFEFITEYNPHPLPGDTRVKTHGLVERFEERLRAENWEELKLENEYVWFSNDEDLRQRIEQEIDKYGEFIESPTMMEGPELGKAHQFLDTNSRVIDQFDFFSTAELREKIRYLKYSADADDTLREEWAGHPFNDGTIPMEEQEDVSGYLDETFED